MPRETDQRRSASAASRSAQDAELVAQGEDLELKGCAAAEQRQEGREECCEHNGGRGSMENGQLAFYQSDPDFREPQFNRLAGAHAFEDRGFFMCPVRRNQE